MNDTNKTVTKSTHVVMFSGGLDSYLLLLHLLSAGITPKLVYSAHGSSNHFDQLHQAWALAKKHNLELIVDDSLKLKEHEDFFIPFRNGLLATVGATYGDRVWFAIMDGEQSYGDCQQLTFETLSMSLSLMAGKPIVVDSPFWDKTKTEVIADLQEKYYDRLKETFSCHRGGTKHCGYCTACFRRFCSFVLNGIKDEFEVNPAETGLAEEYLSKARSNHYDDKRSKEIITALELVNSSLL